MSKKKKKFNFWRSFWMLLSPSHGDFKKILGFLMVVEVVALIGPYSVKMIIDKFVNFKSEEIWLIVAWIGVMFFAEQSKSMLYYFQNNIIFKAVTDIEYYLSVQFQEKMVFLSLNYHEKENTGNKITKIEKGVGNVVNFLTSAVWEFLPVVIQFFVTLIILFVIDWRFAVTFLVFAPIFVWITYSSNKRLYPVRKKRFKSYEVASGKMAQAIMNINAVKSFVQEKREVSEYRKVREGIRIKEFFEWQTMLKSGLKRSFTIDLGRATMLFLGCWLVWNGNVSVGSLVFVVTLSEKAFFSLHRLSRFYDRVEESRESVRRFIDLIETENDIVSPENGIAPKDLKGEISFENVTFSYEGSKEKALNKVNIEIKPGSFVALVGPSGGGKTTLARMIYRHYDPVLGRVLLDGIDLKDYDLYGFRKFISIVPQEVEIFDASIADNISYGNPKAAMKEIKEAARIANAEEFIDKLEKGYNTVVGERGMKLSGGQRQRIGIARAILANPRILIFDEATSNLDSQSERLIQESMDRIAKNRTTIVIAHRLSTIQKAEKIIVIENGKIMEQGSHSELLKKKSGLYNKLTKLQSMGDID